MKIWIDIINSSHALFFNPIISDLQSDNIFVTVRDRAETIDLLESFGIKGDIIGKYYKDNIKKSLFMIQRTILLNYKIKNFDYAISFENGMSIAVSKFRKRKSILFCDNDLKFIQRVTLIQDLETMIKSMANFIIVPDACKESFRKCIKRGNIISYDGYKEDVYIADFKPDNKFNDKIPYDNYVALRPEALDSFYVKDKRSIVTDILHIFEKENINVIYLPREKEDISYAKGFNVYIPKKALNGLDLVYYGDAVLTGSGTMAREAACMNRTAVSFFPGNKLLSVDKQLIEEGKMFHSRDPKEIVNYVLSNKKRNNINFGRSKTVKKEVLELINISLNKK